MEASIGVNLRVTAHSNQGGRKYMEDMFCVAYQPTSDERDLLYAYFGIFDGHGGREAAMYAKTHLMDHIVSQKNFWSDDDELVKRAIHDGFIITHHAMWKELERWPKTASGLPSTSGTTASIVFVRRGKMYIGHVGDSAIILGLQDPDSAFWRAEQLTRDHKPESKAENARIQSSGGKVVCKSGVPRVVWNRPRIGHKGPVRRSTHIDEIPFLAVARSLGDLWSYNSVNDEFVVSPEPDVSVVDIDVKTHRCIILGSDGLWNMVNPQDAVNSVFYAERNNERQLLSSPPDVSSSQVKNWINPSKRLVDRALDRWLNHNLRADNTSVVTVVIDPPGPPKAQVLRQSQSRSHVVRQSVSSVVDPNTSKTVPAMVLDPIPGHKPATSASPFTGQNYGSRNYLTPVSSFTNHRTDNKPYTHPSDAERMANRSYAAPTMPVADKYKASSSNESKTRRILMKRKIEPSSSSTPESAHSSASSNSVSCSNVNLPAETMSRSRSDHRTEALNCGTSRSNVSLDGSTETSPASREDDVQINEISSSSEGKRAKYSTDESSGESPNKRRKFKRNSTEPGASQRPSTRLSSGRNSTAPERRPIVPDTTPTTTQRCSRRGIASAPPAVLKSISRRPRPKERKINHNTPERRPMSKSASQSPNQEGSRNLRSVSQKAKRVTRSMNSK